MAAKIKTYGEAHIAEQHSMVLKNGEWTQTVHIQNKPKRLPRDKAGKYYNKKLFEYWMNQMEVKKTKKAKAKRLKFLMFWSPDRERFYEIEES
jgi:hypothetical protein